jgi:hypothetical protein
MDTVLSQTNRVHTLTKYIFSDDCNINLDLDKCNFHKIYRT